MDNKARHKASTLQYLEKIVEHLCSFELKKTVKKGRDFNEIFSTFLGI